ncbi:MAG: TonB-dependent receptor plug domain-containing protein, partial [Chitinophagaceae bacterium]
MKKQLLLIFCLLLMNHYGFSQRRALQGEVVSQNGSPLPGATVISISGGRSTITDDQGKFSLPFEERDTILVRYIGYETAHIPVTQGKIPGIITLKGHAQSLNELVFTGYMKEKKKDLTGAVSVVNMNEIKNSPVGNPIKALQGHIPGVYITTDGSPQGGATVRIRGIGTLGNNDPLYIIDGMPTTKGLEELNPADIKSIQVLKDASSASIYGSRAANGVIIVTTKTAKAGTSKINFNYSSSIQYYNTR